MNRIVFIISGLLLFWCSYKLITFLIFQRLKSKLKGADIRVFIRFFGKKYQYRMLNNGLLRCKWSNGWLIVKANFDEEGKLICNEIISFKFFRLKSEILFTG